MSTTLFYDKILVITLAQEKWPIDFKKNAQTLPSIELRLSPPEDPLPQVTAEVMLLERSRMEFEEGQMAKLEDAYNVELEAAQTQILEAVERAVQVFNSPEILQKAIKGTFEANRLTISAASSFLMLAQKHASAMAKHGRQSFLMIHAEGASKAKFLDDLIEGQQPPAVKIQLADIKEPDLQIKQKIDQIEQLMTDEETKMFELAHDEFAQLTRIMIAEIEKNIQIQLNPYLMDSNAVVTAVSMAQSASLGGKSEYSSPFGFTQIKQRDNGSLPDSSNLEEYAQPQHDLTKDQSINENLDNVHRQKIYWSSFLQLKDTSTAKTDSSFGPSMEKQLNVRITQSEKPYPTVDEIVSEMQRKRFATERLERMKILQLQLKLLKAEDEMLKESLHTAMSKVLTQFGPGIEAIKAETALKNISNA